MERLVITVGTILLVWGFVRLYKHKRFPKMMILSGIMIATIGTAIFHVTNLRFCQMQADHFLQTHPIKICNLSCQAMLNTRVNACR